MEPQESRILALELKVKELENHVLVLMKFILNLDLNDSKLDEKLITEIKKTSNSNIKNNKKIKCELCSGTGIGAVSNLGLEKCIKCKGSGSINVL